MTFAVPDFAMGNGARFRISASAASDRDSPWSCPAGLALNARQRAQSLQPNDASRWRRGWDDASGLHFAIRDGFRRLCDGDAVDDIVAAEQKLTHAQRRFARHALATLADLVADAGEAAGTAYRVVDDVRADAAFEGMAGEVTVFGPHLASADGAVHEVVRLRLKALRTPTERDHDWVAVAAVALSHASGVDAAAQIRVSEFSLQDGRLRTSFAGDRGAAMARHAERGWPVPAALRGGAYRPGSACGECAFLNVCPAVPQLRGVLGIPGRAVATRRLTAADLHAYDRCPTAFLAQRRDHLPDGHAEGADPDAFAAARDRGIAVHAWLRWAHARTPPRGCADADLPAPGTGGAAAAAESAGLDADAYRVAHPYLVQHQRHCPVGLDGLAEWAAERRVVVYDADADVVVISTPDLICAAEGSGEQIWRETKTAATLPPDPVTAMHRYPGFALNIAILAAQARGQAPGPVAHAELEVLTPDAAETMFVSTSDGALVAEAQRVVADIARRFAADLAFERKPSGACATCSAHRWCDPPPPAAAATAPAYDDAEFGDLDDPF